MKYTDRARSIRQKLLNLSRARGEDYNYLLILYVMERFLYRLGKSKYQEQFILKGALMLYCLEGNPYRMTSDIDLLSLTKLNKKEIEAVLKDVGRIPCEEDAILFHDKYDIVEIRKNQPYGGVRVKGKASLGNALLPISIDIGFGDFSCEVSKRKYPVLLALSAPHIPVYSLENSISEKFHAIVENGMFNSRMKDYYDIYEVIMQKSIDKKALKMGIRGTFEVRNTLIPKKTPIGLTGEFYSHPDKINQWKGFNSRIGSERTVSFGDVVNTIKEFFMEILNWKE